MTRVGRLRNVRVSLAIAVALSLGLFGLGQIDGDTSSALPGTGMIEQGHKPGHPEPPGCKKVKPTEYGKKPKKNCPSGQGSEHPGNG